MSGLGEAGLGLLPCLDPRVRGRAVAHSKRRSGLNLKGGSPGRSGPHWQGSPKGRPGLPAGQTGGDRRSSTGGPELPCLLPQPVRGRAGPCRRGICQWPPGRLESKRSETAHRFVRTSWTCKTGSAAGLQVCWLSADFKQEGPSDSPSRAPRHLVLVGPGTRSSRRSMDVHRSQVPPISVEHWRQALAVRADLQ